MADSDRNAPHETPRAAQPDDARADRKSQDLEPYRSKPQGEALRTNQGVRIADDQNTLRAGARGPSLLEDFIMREKITHFDHERIPERVVHARGSAAHGVFRVYESMAEYTKAAFLQDPAKETPVYVRFSTVQGPRGSADTVRDVRGFAVKFYTDEGNYDLVGNNMPVFFIQDAIKFPDFVHAVKPEAPNEMPTGASAHDTFWDFVSLVPESAHMVAWLMSDRAIPRSFRTMEGFGVHTFRFVNAQGVARFVKLHWRPVLGSYSLLWDEAQKIAGHDPDFHRRDLWEAIERGDYPEYELGVQIIEARDQHAFGFDLLDPTKLIPEETVPVKLIGKMTLNRNPDNFFAETEQVAFHPGHLVPGIDFTDDPLLQGRLFSYTDTQLSRLGGPNFHELPINRPVCPFANLQRDAMHRQTIDVGQASYEPNSLNGGWPKETDPAGRDGGFDSYPETVEGAKVRVRSGSFADHFSQAALFYQSMSDVERRHIRDAYRFELGKVTRPEIRARVVDEILARFDAGLAAEVAEGLGLPPPPASAPAIVAQPLSPALSLLTRGKRSVRSRKVALVATPGADTRLIERVRRALTDARAVPVLVAPTLARIGELTPEATLAGMPSVMFDAVFVCGGDGDGRDLVHSSDARHFLQEAFKHLKAIAAVGSGRQLLGAAHLPEQGDGVCVGHAADLDQVVAKFFDALSEHRVWSREPLAQGVPA
ncbi:catalase HPII [Burkholderia pseudomallei]|uniref:Catalase n=6 Tax=Burkholderia pseudomallei TaxID=28450 RepID=A0A095FR74_BURPE|nr:catalase HPII [Burkholderia pseudomallei]EDU10133.1 catalase [Burkholderia pseudomallei 1655]EEP49925.1 catalase hpII (hydroxyperoxidase ii) [Burkholderia pseudomallei MSHR346]EMP74169.1 hydroperoxidase II [Burkholderia pseudomallei MSHR1043]EQA85816.1 hydroperoxidase II [Burkholderia pseudomallei MSHR338]KGS57206.1 catalase family protein [Burkholderia pseudomallei MSHR5609]KGS94189.1 catalase family protein [Burkholderia pseudomallei MSHR7498]KGV19358.1 catalase family protein [Burkhold